MDGGESAPAILAKILFEDTPRVGALWPDVPEDLDELVARMLAQDPALRPRDGAQLATALAALGPQAHTTAAAPSGVVRRPRTLTGSERRFGMLDTCIDEREARVGIVTAPPGMGKSRLAAELVSRVRERGDVAIWIGRGDSLRAGSTLGPHLRARARLARRAGMTELVMPRRRRT